MLISMEVLFLSLPAAQEYLAQHGLSKFFKWYDYMSWYPIGRPIGELLLEIVGGVSFKAEQQKHDVADPAGAKQTKFWWISRVDTLLRGDIIPIRPKEVLSVPCESCGQAQQSIPACRCGLLGSGRQVTSQLLVRNSLHVQFCKGTG